MAFPAIRLGDRSNRGLAAIYERVRLEPDSDNKRDVCRAWTARIRDLKYFRAGGISYRWDAVARDIVRAKVKYRMGRDGIYHQSYRTRMTAGRNPAA